MLVWLFKNKIQDGLSSFNWTELPMSNLLTVFWKLTESEPSRTMVAVGTLRAATLLAQTRFVHTFSTYFSKVIKWFKFVLRLYQTLRVNRCFSQQVNDATGVHVVYRSWINALFLGEKGLKTFSIKQVTKQWMRSVIIDWTCCGSKLKSFTELLAYYK